MKKTYMHPEMEIVEIKGQVLLAGSALDLKDTGYDVNQESLAPELGDDFVVFDE
jgi:hypothetical protein